MSNTHTNSMKDADPGAAELAERLAKAARVIGTLSESCGDDETTAAARALEDEAEHCRQLSEKHETGTEEHQELVTVLCAALRKHLRLVPLATSATMALILAEVKWLGYLSRVEKALPILSAPEHIEVMWDAALAPRSEVGHRAADAVSNMLIQVVPLSERAVANKVHVQIMTWLNGATLPEQTAHAVVVARLAFILFARCPQWARGPDEWLGLVGRIVDRAHALLDTASPEGYEVVAELLRCLMCATGDLKTFDADIGKTRGKLQSADVERSYTHICSVVARVLKDTRSPQDVKRSAIEVCVNAPPGYAGALVGACGVSRQSAPEPQPGTLFPPAGAKATEIIERHWDPDEPGQETLSVWTRDEDSDVDEGSQGHVPQEEATAAAQSVCDLEVVDILVAELDKQLLSDETANVPFTGALLAVLSGVGEAVSIARRHLKNRLLPRHWDRTRRPDDGESLRARFTRQLRGEDMMRCRQFGELMFVICHRSGGRMMRRVGFGLAAGYLSARGFTDASEAAVCGADSDTESEIEVDIDPVTAMLKGPTPPKVEMSEEQQEHEAHELMILMDKMEKLGLIQTPKPP